MFNEIEELGNDNEEKIEETKNIDNILEKLAALSSATAEIQSMLIDMQTNQKKETETEDETETETETETEEEKTEE